MPPEIFMALIQGMTNQILDAVVYKLTPSSNGWTFNALYTFPGGNQAGPPYAGVVFDSHGNLWGTTNAGGLDQCGGLPLNETCGILFQLTPSGSGWTENTVKQFDLPVGGNPYGNLIVDPSGNIYGTNSTNGPNGGGSVYQLNPGTGSLNVLYGFTGDPSVGGGPLDGLAMDASGNLYGTTYLVGAHNAGQVSSSRPPVPAGFIPTFTILRAAATELTPWPAWRLIVRATFTVSRYKAEARRTAALAVAWCGRSRRSRDLWPDGPHTCVISLLHK